MIKTFFSSDSIWQHEGLALIRIIVGVFMMYHGWEVLDKNKMAEYSKWLAEMKFSSPTLMAYLGKGSELVSGVLITIGLFTRIAIIPLAITMLIICFGLGKGRIFMEDQHPFLFILLSLVFFFTGAGKWSVDYLVFSKSKVT
jgi:uncharacterized membrane protein YphA (DoxX/SURF4 family)